MARPLHVLREAALWLAAAIGTVCLLAAFAGIAFGMTPLIFRSGSMSPGIPTGSLGISVSTPAADLAVGDIVSVVWSGDIRVTHRITGIEAADAGAVTLTTRGDANDDVDLQKVTVLTADRLVWSTPGLGYAFQEVTKPQWVFGLGVVVGVLVILVFRGSRPTELAARRAVVAESPPRHAQNRSPHGHRRHGRAGTAGVAAIATLALVASAIAPGVTGTLASFNNSGAATGSFATGTLQPPTGLTCSITGPALGAKTINLAWTAPATGVTPTSYLVSWAPLAVGTPGSTTSATTSVALSPTLLTLAVTYTFTVQSVVGSWKSTASVGKNVLATTSIVVACL